MSEANTQGQGESQTPITPTADEGFDENWQRFMGHDFGDDDAGSSGESTESGTNTDAGSSGTDTVSGSSGNDTISSASGQDSAVAPASGDAPGGDAAKDEIDPALVAAMLGFAEEPAPQPGSAAPSGSEPSGSEPAAGEDEPFMPFKPSFKLKPELLSALFESEDMATREQALVNVLAAFGNTITQVIEQRHREHYAPQLVTAIQTATSERQVGMAIQQDFYGAYPELQPYKKAVVQAMKIVSDTPEYKGKPYSQEIRDKAAALARRTLEHAGLIAPKGKAPPAASAAPVPPTKQSGTPFEAGGSRQSSGSDNGPADLVAQLSEWG